MKKASWLAVGVCVAAVLGCTSPASGPSAGAKADLLNGKGEKVGSATLTQEGSGVRIRVDLWNLPPGTHAMHIHAVGQCHDGAQGFKAAGGHFNPFGKKHGRNNPEGPHAGDLPNFDVGADGKAFVDVSAPLVTLEEGASNSLFHPGGTCIVVHAKPDDHVTDPAGNAGDRIACGVITK